MFLFYIAVEATCTNQKDCLAAAKDYIQLGVGATSLLETIGSKGATPIHLGYFAGISIMALVEEMTRR